MMDSRFNELQQMALDAITLASELPAAQILTTKEKSVTDITATSKVSVWRLILFIIVYLIFQHEKDTKENMKKFRTQNRENLRAQILNFHDGLPLNWVWDDETLEAGHFEYDLTGVDDAEERKVIDRCAIRKNTTGRLVIKIATDNAGSLEAVAPDVEARVDDYIDTILPPGTQYTLVNKNGDSLKFDLTAYVDPQVIDLATGKLLNTDQDVRPVVDAVNSYLGKLEFNGAFVSNFFIAECINPSSGVRLVTRNSIQWKYDAFPFAEINEIQIAESGYFKFLPGDLTINYLPYAVVDL